MKVHRNIQILALTLLMIVAALNLHGQLTRNVGSLGIYLLPIILGFAMWAFLLWKIYERPKQWGLGVGIFLICMSALQIYLWHLAMNRPDHPGFGIYVNPWNFVWNQTPLVLGGICCILLKWSYPNIPQAFSENADKPMS